MKIGKLFTLGLILALMLSLIPAQFAGAAASELFFSEYIEGSSFNKAVEIYNGTGSTVDLSTYTIELYSNGAASPSQSAALSGTLADGDVFVIAHGSADPAILAVADTTNSSVINFNGDDALVLRNGSAVVDSFGQVGFDPGSEWTGGGQDDTLRRAEAVCAGDTDPSDAFDASVEWVTFAQNTFDGLGSHTANCGGGGSGPVEVSINEIRIDQPSDDIDEYFELAAEPGTSLDGLTYLVIGDGSAGSGVIEAVVNLSGNTVPASGYFVAAESTFTLGTADLTTSLNFENSDNVTHLLVAGFSGSNGDDLDTNDDGILDVTPWSDLLDLIALVEEENPPSSTEYHYGPPSVGPDGSFVPGHVFACSGVWLIGAFGGGDDTPGAANNCPPPVVTINELRIDQPGDDNDEYFELAAAPGASLDGLTYLVIGDGTGGSGVIEAVVNLSGNTVPASGYFVAAENTFTLGVADLTTSLNFENSDNVTHLLVRDFTGANGDDLDTDDDGVLDATPWSELVDLIALVEEENPPSGTEYHYGPPSVGPDGSFVPGHAYVCDDGWRIGNFGGGEDTPGAENACAPLVQEVKIHDVQGDGASSPLVGQTVIVEGIVVGDFQDGASGVSGDLNGFFVQEEDADADNDPLTSEGIFVYDGSSPAVDVAVGDLVSVEGAVSEFDGLTEITSFSGVTVLSGGNALPTVSNLSLPVTSVDDFEAYESMYVTFTQALYISEYFNFDRFGEIVLTSERQFQPTAVYEPGSSEAAALAMANTLGRITLDDGRTSQNPDPAIHPNGMEFTLSNRFRGGDTVANVTGVMHYAFGLYRVQPTEGADYSSENPRTNEPDDVGGNLQVASFNVLNYFTTLDDGVNDICGPDGDQECRGADDAEEFTRQRDKIIAALTVMDADVVGLIEIENYPGDVPTADLVSGLNDVMGAGTYDYVETGALGIDAIRQAFIYKPATVSLVGDYAVLDDQSFTNPRGYVDGDGNLEEKSRPALAQTFIDNETGGVFTVVVNHLKSKGSSCGPGDDDPEAGSCNLTRTLGAQVLVDWLATDPTGSGDEDFLIIGDLNSYDKEDPIDEILKGADDTLGTSDDYTDLLYQYIGEYAYSYVFDGQLGYLDYAIANAGLADEITGVTVWHINADEPDLIDYDTSFKQDAQDDIYAADPYRSSDHDPVIVGLDVCDEIAPTFDELSVSPDMLWPANHKYVDVEATVVVSDNFDPNPTVELVSVESNEPDNGDDDGDTVDDIVIVDDFHFQLRAERSGIGTGRFYTITYKVTDACGNSTTQSVTVTVPLSQGEG